jgi:hypothetical protein
VNPIELQLEQSNNPIATMETPKAIEAPKIQGGATIQGKPLNLHIRINPGDINLNVDATTTDSVADLKKLIAIKTSGSEDVRTIYHPVRYYTNLKMNLISTLLLSS